MNDWLMIFLLNSRKWCSLLPKKFFNKICTKRLNSQTVHMLITSTNLNFTVECADAPETSNSIDACMSH